MHKVYIVSLKDGSEHYGTKLAFKLWGLILNKVFYNYYEIMKAEDNAGNILYR